MSQSVEIDVAGPPIVECCATCKFCRDIQGENGWCHRRAPQVISRLGEPPTTMFPVIKPTWWCGEWELR